MKITDAYQDGKGTLFTAQQRMRWLDSIIRLNGHEFEQTLGDGEGQSNLACCSPWGYKMLDVTEQLNNNNIYHIILLMNFKFPYLNVTSKE